MKSILVRCRWTFAVVACLLGAEIASAQPNLDSALPAARLYLLTPPGGKIGSTVEMTVTGADLDEIEGMRFSHPGIKAELVPTDAAPAPTPTPMPPPKKPRGNQPAAGPAAKFKVTIAGDVPVGFYDARVVCKWGISNPRTFVVGDLTEVMEKEPNNDVTEAQRVELNSTINGSMGSPTDVDYFIFSGKKGQRVVFSCLATSIDSRFHPGMEIYDAKGRILANGRNYREDDALTDVTLPEDGDYQVRLFSFTHTQGNTEHFYRLSISTGPWIDAIHPCIVDPGKANTLTVFGRNLPGGKIDPEAIVDGRPLEKITVTVQVPNDAATLQRLNGAGYLNPTAAALDGFEYRVKNGAQTSNGFMLAYSQAPVVLDNEKPKTAEAPQEIAVPCDIAGRVERKRDRDWYAFTAKKGEIYNIEVHSERLGSPALMYFSLRNAATKQDIFDSVDSPDFVSGKFYTLTSDPAPYRFTVPADGKYLLLVGSRLADASAGPRHYYRVRITPDQPDFRLVALPYANGYPEAITLNQAGEQAVNVYAMRRDGFTGEIALSVEGLPAGVTAVPQTVGASLKEAHLVLSATADAAPWAGEIKIKGTAVINGKRVEREARAGGMVWPLAQPQNFAPTISRVERSLALAVRDKAPYRLEASLDKPVLLQGDKANLKFKLTRHWEELKGPIVAVAVVPGLQSNAIPQGLTFQQVTLAAGQNEATQAITIGSNTPPGVYSIVFRSQTNFNFSKDPKDPKAPKVANANIIQPSTPIVFTVLPKSVATVSLSNGNPQIKPDGTVEVVVKVARLNNYEGKFKVHVVLPPTVKGISIEDVIIPAGKNEATLFIDADDDAALGNRADLVVKVTATLSKVPVVHEAKLAVNVVK